MPDSDAAERGRRMTHVIRTPHGLLDLRAIAADWERAQRANREYRAVPDTTTREIVAPCITDCGRNARGARGICRECTRSLKETR